MTELVVVVLLAVFDLLNPNSDSVTLFSSSLGKLNGVFLLNLVLTVDQNLDSSNSGYPLSLKLLEFKCCKMKALKVLENEGRP